MTSNNFTVNKKKQAVKSNIENDFPWHDMKSSDKLDDLLSVISKESAIEIIGSASLKFPYLWNKVNSNPLDIELHYEGEFIGKLSLKDLIIDEFGLALLRLDYAIKENHNSRHYIRKRLLEVSAELKDLSIKTEKYILANTIKEN